MASTNGKISLSVEGIEKAVALAKTGDRNAYIESLRKRVASYERRFNLPSDLLRNALASRKLTETEEIVKWIHAREALVELEGEHETPSDRPGRISAHHATRGRG